MAQPGGSLQDVFGGLLSQATVGQALSALPALPAFANLGSITGFQSSQEPASLLEGWKQYAQTQGSFGSFDLEGQGRGYQGGSTQGGASSSSASSSSSSTSAWGYSSHQGVSSSPSPAAVSLSGAGPVSRPALSHSTTLQPKSGPALGLDANPFFRSASESVSGVFTSVSKNVQDLPSNIHKTAAAMPSQRAVMHFAGLLGAGIFFMSLAFTIFLPIIAIAPQKFALCFTVGSSLAMGAFFALKGPAAQLESMLAADRIPFTLFFTASLLATLYCSMVMHSYILSVLASGAQVVALAYYVVSFFPGGTTGLRFLVSTLTSTVRGVVGI